MSNKQTSKNKIMINVMEKMLPRVIRMTTYQHKIGWSMRASLIKYFFRGIQTKKRGSTHSKIRAEEHSQQGKQQCKDPKTDTNLVGLRK